MLITINLQSEILACLKKSPETSLKLNSILKILNLKPGQRISLKKEITILTNRNEIIKEGKYYRTNTDFNMKKNNNSGHRTGSSRQNISGEIDFGKDGRIVVKQTNGSDKSQRTYKISDNSSYRLTVGDKVIFTLIKSPEGHTAKIEKVVDHKRLFISGKFENHGSYGIVFPDSRETKREILISPEAFGNAGNGDKVYLEIINPEDLKDENSDLRGEVTEVLGKSGDRLTEEKSIIRKFNLVKEFPREVENEAEKASIDVNLDERVDLRDKTIFTIDPIDAKDFDDAVSVEILEDGTYMLGVHIADVSHYVKEGSALDKEALKRATSVYLVKNVVPMIPEKLSNDICSLKPGEDRLTFSVFIKLSKRCAVKSYEIKKSVIRSKRRFTYEEAQEIIETKKGDFAEELLLMYKLSKSITLKRLKEESLDFDSNEVKFVFDSNGNVDDIVVKQRLDSMRLIEEFMLLANKCATIFVNDLSKKIKIKLPFIYRVHDIPNKDKMKELAEFVKQFGYTINIEEKNSLRKLLTAIEGKPEEFLINNLLIRSMAKAIYTEKNIGHYGLGFKDYSHFTSPIRRYPDLLVHRILYDYIYNEKNIIKRAEHYKNIIPPAGKQSSIMEQNAEQAERESIKLFQGEYINKHIGEEYEGIISGMMQYGMFVEIMDILVEGMIRFRDIEDDYYDYDEKNHIARGRRRGRTFRAGQKVKIKVVRVNKETKKIDFNLVLK
ncbi:MAG: ribonuclease R [Ignavibacteria bacterium]|nr:ribonuclease R [Ignavibacteria bacterium]MBK9406074.1 ribonuclease R [Ignavibacteria bacterium]